MPVQRCLTFDVVEHMSARRTLAPAKKQRGRTKTPGQIFQRLQRAVPAPALDPELAFARWFAALHAVRLSAVRRFLRRAHDERWFVAVDSDPSGALGADVCRNPVRWNAERNSAGAVLRVLRGAHGPLDREDARRALEKIQAV